MNKKKKTNQTNTHTHTLHLSNMKVNHGPGYGSHISDISKLTTSININTKLFDKQMQYVNRPTTHQKTHQHNTTTKQPPQKTTLLKHKTGDAVYFKCPPPWQNTTI